MLISFLILDTETTGLDPEVDQVLEVGAILFLCAAASRAGAAVVSDSGGVQRSRAAEWHRSCGYPGPQPWQQSLLLLQQLAGSAQLAVAHNAAFDRQWFGSSALPDLQLPWLCTMEDIHWPAERLLRPRPSVRDLALAYGVPVWAAHRASPIASIWPRCLNVALSWSSSSLKVEPRHLYRAQVSYDERHLAREAGFRWNDPVNGAWSRRLSERQLEALKLPFNVVPVAS